MRNYACVAANERIKFQYVVPSVSEWLIVYLFMLAAKVGGALAAQRSFRWGELRGKRATHTDAKAAG